jgi:hypothetical protein
MTTRESFFWIGLVIFILVMVIVSVLPNVLFPPSTD